MDNSNVIEGTVIPASHLSLAGVLHIPAVRQIGLLIGVAAAVAAGFAIAMWSQEPAYTQLYTDLEAVEVAEIADALRSADIDYKINTSTGDLMVPESTLHQARMLVASQGLSLGTSTGMARLDEQSSFGTSQFMESARYQHALEAELGRTISSLGAVRDARIHLALPRRTSFIRDQKTASASVLIHLYRGRLLEAEQATAIANLVAASVPNLLVKNVTVLDQYGNLLSSAGRQQSIMIADSQFKYSQRLEETFKARIENLLTPILGVGRVRAEVVADIDFTIIEETRESFDPNRSVIRSEQINEDLRIGSASAPGGVPGALSNQPPETGAAADSGLSGQGNSEQKNTSRSSVRNYEVDRTISHTQPSAGNVRKLSVAVLIDDSPFEGASDDSRLSQDDLLRYTAIVKEAVGFDEARGDSVVILSEAFLEVEDPIVADPPAFWKGPEMRDLLKQILGAALVLAIAFGIVRPMLSGVVSGGTSMAISGEYVGSGQGASMQAMAQFMAPAQSSPAPGYDEKVAAAKNITGHDPARVAQVVKKWVASDE